MRQLTRIVPIAILALLAFTSVANADSFTINVPNSGLSGTPGPYATVTLTMSGSQVHVDVTAYSGFTFFGTNGGNNSMFGFNVVGALTGLSISNCEATGTGTHDGCGIAGGINNGGTGQMDGFGNFDVVIGDVSGSGFKNFTGFSFDVGRTAGFSSIDDLVHQSCGGESCANFVIHVAPTNGNPTGFAGDDGRTTVPEPSSMLLLGSGLAGLAGIVRRKLRK